MIVVKTWLLRGLVQPANPSGDAYAKQTLCLLNLWLTLSYSGESQHKNSQTHSLPNVHANACQAAACDHLVCPTYPPRLVKVHA